MAINGFKADGTTYRYNAEALDGYAPIEDGSITIEKLANGAVANNLTTATAGEAVLDAHQGKVLKDTIDNIGVFTYGTISLTESANTTYATQGTITLQPGVYIIYFSVDWGGSVSGKFCAVLTTGANTATKVNAYSVDREYAVSGVTTSSIGSTVKNVEAQSTYYLRTWQNSGNSVTPTSASITAVRIV